MPWLPLPPCRHPGCPNLQTPARNGFCEQHQAEAERRQHRGRFRTPSRQRGYDRRYELNRAALLAREPLCRLCRQEGRVTLAEQVHHIRPLSEGGSNDITNLMPLCREHHERLHASGGATASPTELVGPGKPPMAFSGGNGQEPASRPSCAPAGLPTFHLLEALEAEVAGRG